jgi:hypothetical protein
MIWVFSEPVSLAVRAYGFLADLALEGVLQYVVAHPADKLGEESCHVRLVLDEVLLEYVPGGLGRGLGTRGGRGTTQNWLQGYHEGVGSRIWLLGGDRRCFHYIFEIYYIHFG